ncbi:MAG: signal peptidase I [Eubacteriales bacterium]
MASNVLIFLTFSFGLFVFITVITTKGDGVPNFLGYSFLSVSTPSMVPTYPVGTIVITKKVKTIELKVGDVISFYSEDPAILGFPNTHRIVSIDKNKFGQTSFVTKGDNNPIADSYPVFDSKVIGKVTGSISSAGNILSKLKNRFVLFFLLVVPLVMIMMFELKNITKLLRQGNEDTPPESLPEHKDPM